MLAERTVASGGIAFGAAFDPEFRVRHVPAETLEEAKRFRKSKYVQSETGDCFRQVKRALDGGRRTVFFGTPCQAAGLLAVLGCRPKNLLTVDFYCHGVPSPLLFSKYVLHLENRLGGRLLSLDFRDKTNGWGVWFSAKSTNRSALRRADEDPFMIWFLSHHAIRESCLHCPFRGKRHVSDLTVGDYWNYCQTKQERNNASGISKVLVNTARGLEALRRVQSDLELEEREFSDKELGSAEPLPVPFSRRTFQRSIGNLDIRELAARFPTRLDRFQKSFRVFRQKARGWIRSRLSALRPPGRT